MFQNLAHVFILRKRDSERARKMKRGANADRNGERIPIKPRELKTAMVPQ